DFNHFINTDTTLVSTVAIVTTYRTVELEGTDLVFGETFLEQRIARYFYFLLAGRAQLARQPLGDDQIHRSSDIECWHPHVAQARQGLRGAVGVQCRHHHVPCLSGLDG